MLAASAVRYPKPSIPVYGTRKHPKLNLDLWETKEDIQYWWDDPSKPAGAAAGRPLGATAKTLATVGTATTPRLPGIQAAPPSKRQRWTRKASVPHQPATVVSDRTHGHGKRKPYNNIKYVYFYLNYK